MGRTSGIGEILRAIAQRARDKVTFFRGPLSNRALSPSADQLLSDALRIAELPSPTEKEAKRAEFILGRLTDLGYSGSVDPEGNILVRMRPDRATDGQPLLLFADMGTMRWTSDGGLARLSAAQAKGAGLADALGPATLLSFGEELRKNPSFTARDIQLLFVAGAPEAPRERAFQSIAASPKDRPCAAIGVRGIGLDELATRQLGSYRLSMKVVALGGMDSVQREGSAISVVASVVQRIEGVKWDEEGLTSCRVRRMEAGTGFGTPPTEGVIEFEIESADSGVLDLAMRAVSATAATSAKERGAEAHISVLSHVPVGDSAASASLVNLARRAAKTLHLKLKEGTGIDAAAHLTARGIPALSVGIATGRIGIEYDEVQIDSISMGRKFLFELLRLAGAEDQSMPSTPHAGTAGVRR